LKDINFEVNHGEAIGIIGKNGAGKSTILKILSKVTAPTSGQIKTKGRIASLLEVGTGFHPELTGRENIFLNGAILGMTKTEISRKLEEIIAFSGVEKYIDTPVKRYSSGMYVRLAFAVAAYLEPEILIVDEVLAVGDLEFQDKCLGKMNDVSKNEGRTVIFVSHNMNAIQSLCSRSLYISSGRIMRNGPTNEVVAFYKEDISNFKFTADAAISDTTQRRGNGKCRFTKIEIKNKQGEKVQSFEYGEPIIMELEFIVLEDMKELATAIVLRSGRNKEDITDFFSKLPFKQLKAGSTYKFNINIDSPDIRPGDYILYFWLGDISRRPYDVVDGVTPPINIYSTKSYIELGFDPSIFTGYFSLKAKLTS
jgi:lipopolysaccharide transport system ATP-binding protein